MPELPVPVGCEVIKIREFGYFDIKYGKIEEKIGDRLSAAIKHLSKNRINYFYY